MQNKRQKVRTKFTYYEQCNATNMKNSKHRLIIKHENYTLPKKGKRLYILENYLQKYLIFNNCSVLGSLNIAAAKFFIS